MFHTTIMTDFDEIFQEPEDSKIISNCGIQYNGPFKLEEMDNKYCSDQTVFYAKCNYEQDTSALNMVNLGLFAQFVAEKI